MEAYGSAAIGRWRDGEGAGVPLGDGLVAVNSSKAALTDLQQAWIKADEKR